MAAELLRTIQIRDVIHCSSKNEIENLLILKFGLFTFCVHTEKLDKKGREIPFVHQYD